MNESPRFIIVVPGSIMHEDGGYDSANTKEERDAIIQTWQNMNFTSIVVYEKADSIRG